MLKIFLFVAIATVQCLEVKDKLKEDPVIKYQPPTQQGQRLDGFRPRSDWSYYFPSWSQYFKDDDEVEESPNLLKRLAALEQMVKKLNDLYKIESSGNKKPESPTTANNKVEATSSPCKKDPPPKEPMTKVPEKNERNPEIKDKPAKPEKNTEASEDTNKSKKPAEKPQEPVEAAEPTHDKNSSEDSPSAGHRKGTTPPNAEEETLRE